MTPDKLIHMANQIAAFFETQPGDPATGVAEHLAKFWEPRMRAQLAAHVAAGGEGLRPSVIAAVGRLTAPARSTPARSTPARSTRSDRGA